MRIDKKLMLALIISAMAMAGGAFAITRPDKTDYSDGKDVKSLSDKPELIWMAPNNEPDVYDDMVYTPITYYPVRKPTSHTLIDDLLHHTDMQYRRAWVAGKTQETIPGSRRLIFRKTHTGGNSEVEGILFNEVLLVTLLDTAEKDPVVNVVRRDDGMSISTENYPIAPDNIQQVIEDILAGIVP